MAAEGLLRLHSPQVAVQRTAAEAEVADSAHPSQVQVARVYSVEQVVPLVRLQLQAGTEPNRAVVGALVSQQLAQGATAKSA